MSEIDCYQEFLQFVRRTRFSYENWNFSALKKMFDKQEGEFQRRLNTPPVMLGRKPSWFKKQEEWFYALNNLSVAGSTPRRILRRFEEFNRRYDQIHEPSIPHNLFRDFYFRVVKKYDVYPRDHIFDAFNRHDQYGHQRGANVNCFFDEYKERNTESLTLPAVSNPYKSVLYVSDAPEQYSKNWII